MRQPFLLPPNPLGIHFLKASMVLVLFFIHGEAWINQISGVQTHIETNALWKIIVFLGMFNVLLPCTAGAMLRLDSHLHYRGLRLEKFNWTPILWAAFGLALAESVKAAVTLGLEIFFGWDVLHLIAISMLLIFALARISILAVWLSFFLCLALTPLAREWLHPFQVTSQKGAIFLNTLGGAKWFLFVILEFVFLVLLVRLWQTPLLERKYKIRTGLVGLIGFASLTFFCFCYRAPDYFTARILNLPVGMLTGDELGLHFWPFFPWYAEIAFGYLLFDLLLRWRSRALRLFLFFFSFVAEWLYFKFAYAGVIQEYDPTTGFSAAMFRGSLNLLFVNLAIFAGMTVMWEAIARSRRVRGFLSRHPRGFKIPYMFSRTILLSYIFMNSVGMLLAYPFALYLPHTTAMILYPIFTILLWLYFGQALMDFLNTRSIVLRFKSNYAGTSRTS